MLFAVCQRPLAHFNAIIANACHLTGVWSLRLRVYLNAYLGRSYFSPFQSDLFVWPVYLSGIRVMPSAALVGMLMAGTLVVLFMP